MLTLVQGPGQPHLRSRGTSLFGDGEDIRRLTVASAHGTTGSSDGEERNEGNVLFGAASE
jgi:hypothetical protein